MSCHAVHQKLHSLGEATASQLAEAMGMTDRKVRNRLGVLMERGLAEAATPAGSRPMAYRSAAQPQATDPGLSTALIEVLDDRRTMRRLLADLAGVARHSVDNALSVATLDTPDTGHQILDRALAEAALLRLAELLEKRAARCREVAARCAAARRGEGA